MIRGILQFTPSIAFRYVLHRCESRDIRCRESFWIRSWVARGHRLRCDRGALRNFVFLGAFRAGVCCLCVREEEAPRGGILPTPGTEVPQESRERVRGSPCLRGIDNDPSAGSPTETLLRLLLPLNDKVQWTSRDVAGSGPPASPRSEHFTGPFNR